MNELEKHLKIAEEAIESTFETIKVGCKRVAEDDDTISLAEFHILLFKGKWGSEHPEIESMVRDQHKLLEGILRATIKNCLVLGTDRITLAYVNNQFDVFMAEYRKTINKLKDETQRALREND
jgi:hypothetical protein